MAADLHIHVVNNGATEDDVKNFSANCLGSKYFAGFGAEQMNHDEWRKLYDRIGHSSNIWVGEVSWLKAALFGDADSFVPDLVEHVSSVIGEDFPVVTDELIEAIKQGYSLKNATPYALESWDKIETFLREHMGEKLFTVSW